MFVPLSTPTTPGLDSSYCPITIPTPIDTTPLDEHHHTSSSADLSSTDPGSSILIGSLPIPLPSDQPVAHPAQTTPIPSIHHVDQPDQTPSSVTDPVVQLPSIPTDSAPPLRKSTRIGHKPAYL